MADSKARAARSTQWQRSHDPRSRIPGSRNTRFEAPALRPPARPGSRSVGTPSALWSGPPPGARRPTGGSAQSKGACQEPARARFGPAGRRAPGRGDNPGVDLGDGRRSRDAGGQTPAIGPGAIGAKARGEDGAGDDQAAGRGGERDGAAAGPGRASPSRSSSGRNVSGRVWAATIRRRPPHRGQCRISKANTRLSSAAQSGRAGRVGPAGAGCRPAADSPDAAAA